MKSLPSKRERNRLGSQNFLDLSDSRGVKGPEMATQSPTLGDTPGGVDWHGSCFNLHRTGKEDCNDRVQTDPLAD